MTKNRQTTTHNWVACSSPLQFCAIDKQSQARTHSRTRTHTNFASPQHPTILLSLSHIPHNNIAYAKFVCSVDESAHAKGV